MSTAGTEVMLARLGTIRSHGVSKFSKSGGHFLVAKTTAGATIKGHMDFPVQGAEYKFYGGWKFQKKFNEDAFEFESYEAIVAAGVGGIATYLATHIANVGPSKAKAIVGHFGPDTLGTLKIDPERVKEVPGLPDRVVKSIVEHFQRSQEFDPAAYAALVDLLTTEDHKVPKRIIKALCKTWGSSAPDVIKKRPYSILLPYKRLGWITVDALATSPAIGYASGGLDRHKAAIVEALERIAGEGHTWASRIDVEQIAHELLSGLPRQEAWDGLIAAYIIDVRPDADGSSVSPGSTVALGKYDRAEREIARHIRRLSGGSTGLPFRLSTVGLIGDQVHAAEMVENNAVSLLTGKPGVGKSTVVARIIASCVANDLLSIVVVAPTGKAAKRAAELIGAATDRPIPCTTIHKALGPASNDDDIGTPKEDAKGDRGRDALGFAHGEHEPIEGRLFIIDESAIPTNSRRSGRVRSCVTSWRLRCHGRRSTRSSGRTAAAGSSRRVTISPKAACPCRGSRSAFRRIIGCISSCRI
jgi:exodeoxyribonuclease V alpha subunit